MIDRYAKEYSEYRWRVPAEFNIAEWACRRWSGDAERLALRWENEAGATASLTYAGLQRSANQLSNALRALGVQAGDRVALILPQRIETAVAYLGIFQMGAIAVPLSYLFGPDALEYRLQDSGAKVAIVDAQTIAVLWPLGVYTPVTFEGF